MELVPNAIVNLGVGIPSDIAAVGAEEKVSDMMTFTTEAGGIGGVPASLPHFGQSYNGEAVIGHANQFDFYDGGGLDVAFLGLAQADEAGNVNVSKFKGRAMGPGGFINVSQGAKKVVYCGTFTAKGLKVAIEDGKLSIIQEGKEKNSSSRWSRLLLVESTLLRITRPWFILPNALYLPWKTGK